MWLADLKALYWDIAKSVRHRTLTPASAGSSPAIPATLKFNRKEDDSMEELKLQNRIRMLSARTGRENGKIINKLKRRLYQLQGDKS